MFLLLDKCPTIRPAVLEKVFAFLPLLLCTTYYYNNNATYSTFIVLAFAHNVYKEQRKVTIYIHNVFFLDSLKCLILIFSLAGSSSCFISMFGLFSSHVHRSNEGTNPRRNSIIRSPSSRTRIGFGLYLHFQIEFDFS